METILHVLCSEIQQIAPVNSLQRKFCLYEIKVVRKISSLLLGLLWIFLEVLLFQLTDREQREPWLYLPLINIQIEEVWGWFSVFSIKLQR